MYIEKVQVRCKVHKRGKLLIMICPYLPAVGDFLTMNGKHLSSGLWTSKQSGEQ